MLWIALATANTIQVQQPFSKLVVGSACIAEVRKGGPATTTLTWKGGSATLDLQDGVLTVRHQGEIRDCKLTAVTPGLRALEASQASNVHIEQLEGKSIDVRLTGAAQVVVAGIEGGTLGARLDGASAFTVESGRLQIADVTATSASTYDLDSVKSDTAKTRIEGASAGSIHVIRKLDARVTGASALAIHGRPTDRSVQSDITSKVTP